MVSRHIPFRKPEEPLPAKQMGVTLLVLEIGELKSHVKALEEALQEAADGWVTVMDGTKECGYCGAMWRGAEKTHNIYCQRARWMALIASRKLVTNGPV